MILYRIVLDVLGGGDVYSQERETSSQEARRLALADFEADVSHVLLSFSRRVAYSRCFLVMACSAADPLGFGSYSAQDPNFTV